MGEYQIWVLVVVVVLSILDAVMKKAKKRGLGLPEGDEPSSASDGEQERPRPVSGAEGASRLPGPAPAPRTERSSSGPRSSTGPRESVPRLPRQPRPSPSTAAPPSAGKRQSAFDILVPPEIRKELEDLVSGGAGGPSRREPSPTRASGPGQPSGTSVPSDRRSLPTPSEASAPPTPDSSWDEGGSLGDWPVPDHDRGAPPVKVRSRAPRPVNVHAREPRRERPAVPSVPATPRSPARPHLPIASRLGFSTMADVRRNIVAREILGAPVALRDDGRWREDPGSGPLAPPPAPPTPPPSTPPPPPVSPTPPPTPTPLPPPSSSPSPTSSPPPRKPAQKASVDKRPISAPGKRPGKRTSDGKSSKATKERLPGFRRPELRCREASDSRSWEVVVDLPDGPSPPKILLDGEPLPTSDGCCRVSNLDASIIAVMDGGSTIDLLDPGPPLIFKTAKHWKSSGRRVRRITRGYFVVIVPAGWQREGSRPPVAPTRATASGYQAHYVYWDGRSNDRVRFAGHDLPLATDTEILKGSTLFDDDRDHGSLFVGDPPELTNPNAFTWTVVGEEGVPDGWRCRFKPSKRRLADLLEGREGWFFVRVYDANAELLASTDFRYSRRLAQIHVDNHAYSDTTILFPTRTGHDLTLVTFVDRTGNPINPPTAIPPDKHADDVRVELRSAAGRVPVRVRLPRLWWRLADDDAEHDWRSVAFRWTPQEFDRLAETATRICLDLPRHVPNVGCGFDSDAARQYRRLKSGYFEIPLEEFLDDLDDFLNEHAPHAESRERTTLGITLSQISRSVSVVHVQENPADEDNSVCNDDSLDEDEFTDDDESVGSLSPDGNDVSPPPSPEPRPGEFFVRHDDSLGSHSWEEARKCGVVNILSRMKKIPERRSRVWVCLSGRRYVGVGIVADQEGPPIQRPPTANGHWTTLLPVHWCDTVHEDQALSGSELLDVSVVVPVGPGPKCRQTLEFLKTKFKWRTDA